MTTKFKKIIKMEFRDSGMTKIAFANKIGISRQMLDKYLAGDASPSYDRAVDMLMKVNRRILIMKDYE